MTTRATGKTTLTVDDRLAIHELLAMHGHLVDAGELDRLDEVLTPDSVYDVSDLGSEPLHGIAAVREASLALGPGNPVGHHVTNVVLTAVDGATVHARSKGIGVNADGTTGSATYEDTVVRGDDGWRISYRRVLARRAPLGR
jgi:hypothetical protein